MTQMLRPSMSSSAAALAAGRLTESMWLAFLSWAPRPRRQFMLGPEESEQWRLLADVEDILRTLGQAPRPLGASTCALRPCQATCATPLLPGTQGRAPGCTAAKPCAGPQRRSQSSFKADFHDVHGVSELKRAPEAALEP